MRSFLMSAWPFTTSATRFTLRAALSLSVGLPPLLPKPMRSSTVMRSAARWTISAPGSGQPSSSCCRLTVSACNGHLSSPSRNPSFVIVRIGATVLVLKAVGVLGVVRARVEVVGDAVVVVVGIGAAVLVLEAVAVLRIVGGLVDVVGGRHRRRCPRPTRGSRPWAACPCRLRRRSGTGR